MAAIPVKEFVKELTDAINQTLSDLTSDESRQSFLDGLSSGFFNLPYQSEEGDAKE